jgi:hypothetical protein
MSRIVTRRLGLACLLALSFLCSCSRDPNVRKQKYLESGDRYYDKGKVREAAIQYSNALQIDRASPARITKSANRISSCMIIPAPTSSFRGRWSCLLSEVEADGGVEGRAVSVSHQHIFRTADTTPNSDS